MRSLSGVLDSVTLIALTASNKKNVNIVNRNETFAFMQDPTVSFCICIFHTSAEIFSK